MIRVGGWLKSLVIYFLDKLLIILVKSPVNNSLMLVRLDAIGDFVIWLDAAKEYSKIFPDKKIILIANSLWADLAKMLPYWESVWAIEVVRFNRSLIYRWKTLSQIRKAGFEVAIQPTYSRVFLLGDSIIRASGAAKRIGSVGDLSNIKRQLKSISDRWYTVLIPANKAPLMELERNAEFIRLQTSQAFEPSVPRLPVLAALPEHLMLQGGYFILFPGASWHGRRWPTEYFAEIIEQLHHRYGWHAVLCGSSAEWALCQSVVDQSQIASVNMAGKTSLTEFVELVRGSKLLVGNETSAVHISAAVGTPVVCVLGGGHYGRFMPYSDTVKGVKPVAVIHQMSCFNCNWNCNQPHDPAGPVPCISRISVAQVLVSTEQAIQRSNIK